MPRAEKRLNIFKAVEANPDSKDDQILSMFQEVASDTAAMIAHWEAIQWSLRNLGRFFGRIFGLFLCFGSSKSSKSKPF